MKNAVQFEPEVNGVRVRYQLSADGNNGVDLRTVLEAMEVELTLHVPSIST